MRKKVSCHKQKHKASNYDIDFWSNGKSEWKKTAQNNKTGQAKYIYILSVLLIISTAVHTAKSYSDDCHHHHYQTLSSNLQRIYNMNTQVHYNCP